MQHHAHYGTAKKPCQYRTGTEAADKNVGSPKSRGVINTGKAGLLTLPGELRLPGLR